MRIAVLGTGANGAGIGADLVRAGHDVLFVEQWPDHVEAMRRFGVRVEMPDRVEVTDVDVVHLCEVATFREKFDLVYLLVKAYDTRWATELISPHLGVDGALVGLQNGMSLRDIESIVGEERAVGGVLEVSAAMFEPGVVERHTPPEASWFALGARNAVAQESAARAAEVLRSAGTVEVVDDIESAKWMKLVLNATELATSAIVDLPLSTAFRLPGMLDVVREAGREAVRTGVARGHRLVPILGLKDVGTDDPDEYVDTLIDAVLEHYTLPTTLTTILQDWRKGRHSEVDEINGLVAREALRLGSSAPVNARINGIAARIESGEIEAGEGNLGLLVGGS